MSETMVAPVATPRKSIGTGKKIAGSKARKSGGAKTVKHASHPPYGQMIKQALKHLKEKKGSSRAAVLKYILQNYKLGGNMVAVNAHLRMALKRGVQSGMLKQVKGVGASGSFRLSDKAATGAPKKPKVKKARKSGIVKKPKAPKAKRASSAAKKPKATKTKKSAKPKSTVRKPKSPSKKASAKKHTKKAVVKH